MNKGDPEGFPFLHVRKKCTFAPFFCFRFVLKLNFERDSGLKNILVMKDWP